MLSAQHIAIITFGKTPLRTSNCSEYLALSTVEPVHDDGSSKQKGAACGRPTVYLYTVIITWITSG
jgi:hypothetical protein